MRDNIEILYIDLDDKIINYKVNDRAYTHEIRFNKGAWELDIFTQDYNEIVNHKISEYLELPKKLESLEDFNKRIIDEYKENQPSGNGISCPDCGCELIDSNPSMRFLSNPSQTGVVCRGCNYQGYRYC